MGRLADKLELKNVELALYEIGREVEKQPHPPGADWLTIAYPCVLPRKGWNERLWDALQEALPLISPPTWKPDKSKAKQKEREVHFLFLLIAYVDVNYAKRGIGAKLAAAQIPLFDTTQVAQSIALDYAAFINRQKT